MEKHMSLEDLELFGFDKETEKLMKALYLSKNEKLNQIPQLLLSYELSQMAREFDKEDKCYDRNVNTYSEEFHIKKDHGSTVIRIYSVEQGQQPFYEEEVIMVAKPDGKCELMCSDSDGREDYRFQIDDEGVKEFREVSSTREK